MRYCALLALAFMPLAAYASPNSEKPLVVVEIMQGASCPLLRHNREQFLDTLYTEENLIFVNCHVKTDDADKQDPFAHQFCNDKFYAYTERLGQWARPNAQVSVNGQWDAVENNLLPAVNLGRLDKIQPIDIALTDHALTLTLPQSHTPDTHGIVTLYVSAPTHGGDSGYIVDPDLALTDDVQTDIVQGKSVPFTTKIDTTPLIIRPILNRHQIGEWHGNAMTVSIPLSDITTMISSYSLAQLSFVALVHKDSEHGRPIAAGQHLSPQEKYYRLPRSTKPDFIKMSR